MSNQQQYSWTESNLIDDVDFEESDAQLFRQLLGVEAPAEGQEIGVMNQMTPGAILKGFVVEITKDHVVIDVGLKSEGLVAIGEFSDPDDIILGNEVEVLLDQTEDHNGQIVLSREKAERQRKWEYIIEHCEEGSIVTGCVLRKVKGGLMVDIGIEVSEELMGALAIAFGFVALVFRSYWVQRPQTMRDAKGVEMRTKVLKGLNDKN